MKSLLFLIFLMMLQEDSFPFIEPQQATLELDAKAPLGEGSIWHPDEKRLYWIDIEGRKLHIYDPVTKQDQSIATGERIGTVVPVKGGGVLAALQNGIFKINTVTGKFTLVANPLTDDSIRFNDGKCDPGGRFWVGTMHLAYKTGAAVLYRLDRDKSLHQLLSNVTISNGIVWTKNKKKMYYIDTPTSSVDVFDYDDATGAVTNRKTAFKIPPYEGFPDGMTIDERDNLWIALWGGGGVACYNPQTGEQLQKISVPAQHTSSCAFGGPDLKTLYITTARGGLSPEELTKYPLSGGVFAVKLNVKGVPANYYTGSIKE